MTDFVDSLLGRSELASIRPLLPTLFEPMPRGDVDEQLPIEAFTNLPADTSAELSAPQEAAPGTFTNPPAAGPTPEPNSFQNFVPREQTLLSASTPRPGAPLRAPLVVPNRDEAEPAPCQPDVIRAETDRGRAQHHHSVTPQTSSRVVTEQSDLQNPPVNTSTSPMSPAPQIGLPRAPMVPETPRRRAAEPAGGSPHAAVRSRDRSREPDVHISIGRVEIKASPPAAVPQRPKKTQKRPQLTLDDYLKSRES